MKFCPEEIYHSMSSPSSSAVIILAGILFTSCFSSLIFKWLNSCHLPTSLKSLNFMLPIPNPFQMLTV